MPENKQQNSKPINHKRRQLLIAGTSFVGASGAVALSVPFVEALKPRKQGGASHQSVKVDISQLKAGDQLLVEWRGKPVFVRRRNAEELSVIAQFGEQLADPQSQTSIDAGEQPKYVQGDARAVLGHEDILVVVGLCTHAGCSPKARPEKAPSDLGSDWQGGYFCPCHGSKFDFAGRVFKNVPAPTNLVIPPYHFVDDNTLVIGEHPQESV